MTDATLIDDLRCSADVARRCGAASREAGNYTVAGHHDAEGDMLCAAADRIEVLGTALAALVAACRAWINYLDPDDSLYSEAETALIGKMRAALKLAETPPCPTS